MNQETVFTRVDITNRKELNTILSRLTELSVAKWGIMQPQNMIEHLIKTLQYSNGKKQIDQKTTEEESRQAKAAFIYTDVEMPIGLKSSLAGETPDPFEFADLGAAKYQLNKELDDFESY